MSINEFFKLKAVLVAPLSTCVPGGGFIPSLLFNNKKKLFD